ILITRENARWRAPRGYVENVADGIALAATDDRAAGQTYNLADEEAPDEAEWVRRVARAARWRGRLVVVEPGHLPLPMGPLPAHLRPELHLEQDLCIDSQLIRQELGYRDRVRAPEALARTVAWERAHPPEAFAPEDFDYAAEDDVLAVIGGKPTHPATMDARSN